MDNERFAMLREMKEQEPSIPDDETSLPPIAIKDIKRLIRKGAKDLDQKWRSAVHLTKKAYDVAGHKIPQINDAGAWSQYQHLIAFSVEELSKARGLRGQYADWRITEPREYDDEDTVIPSSMMPRDLSAHTD